MKKNFTRCSLLSIFLSFTAYSALAAKPFFEEGKYYLFVPRTDLVLKGKLLEANEHELVFIDRYIVKASKANKNSHDDALKSINNAQAVAEYLKSKDKMSLLEPSVLKDIPTSYSRAAITATKLDE